MQNDTSPKTPAWLSLPLIGWLARTVLGSGMGFTYFLLAAVVVLWGLAIATWGVPGLYIPAVIATPVSLLTLLWISRG